MKSKTLMMMDPLEMVAAAHIEAMIRFVALLEIHSTETLEALDDRLESLMGQAENDDQFAFFQAAQRLIRSVTDNDTGE